MKAPAVSGGLTVLIIEEAANELSALISERFPGVRAIVARQTESLLHHAREADVVIASRLPAEFFQRAPRLRWVQTSAAGVEWLLPIRNEVGKVTITNARGMHGDLIADFVMTGIGMLHWDFRRLLQSQSRRQWDQRKIPRLAGCTMGVVGLGAIGGAIACRAKGAGMTTLGTKRDIAKPVEAVDELLPPGGLDELLERSDFVVLAVPHIPQTSGLIGREQLRRMRRTAYLVNIARGSVVVESDLIQALQDKTIAGAFLDVFEREPLPADSPLWTLPNVIATPHLSGYPDDYAHAIFNIFADNFQRFITGTPLRNVIDLDRGY